MEADILSSCSQDPATGPYPETDKSSPHPYMPGICLRSVLIILPRLRTRLPNGLVPSDSLLKFCMRLCAFPSFPMLSTACHSIR